MMTQEEIDAILGEDTRQSSVEIGVVSTEEEDDFIKVDAWDIVKDVSTAGGTNCNWRWQS